MLATLKSKVIRTLTGSPARQVDVLAHERVRLRILFSVAILKLFNFIGGAWDIQWHVAIGRDSLFIPPHLIVMVAFVSGLFVVVYLISLETSLAASGQELPHSTRLGPLRAPPSAFGIFFGYFAALMSAGLDEMWHEIFGIDATLWSPPHLSIMLATMVVDFSLILGIAASSRRLGFRLTWNSPLLWGLALTGAYAFEAVNFQMGEAFIVGFRHGGAGLYGLFYPILLGAFLPLSMLTCIRLARRFWIMLLILALALLLQYFATGIASAGFAILKPVSVIDEYVRLNPNSTAAKAREFAGLLGFHGLIGFEQAWTMTLSAIPLALVALLRLIPWARHHPLSAAPVYSASMVLFSFLWFKQVPPLNTYPINGLHVLLGIAISIPIGLLTGSLGVRLARRVEPDP